MATKLNNRKTGGSRAPDSKRVKINNGVVNTESGSLPLKTGDVKKE